MLRLSTRTSIILTAICFIGMVALQLAWIRSAYQGELALYNKEKKQFESELHDSLRRDGAFKAATKNLLDSYNKQRKLPEPDQDLFTQILNRVLHNISKERGFSILPHNYGIAAHTHDDSSKRSLRPIYLSSPSISAIQMEKAGKLCIHCLLNISDSEHEEYNYELMIFYSSEKTTIYKKMALLVAGSFLVILLLGLLFRQMVKKYQQEKKLSEAKNDFINNLSHELQTPVFAIQMANRIIKEKTTELEALKPVIGIIEKETHQLKEHAQKILELASLENEHIELDLEPTDLLSFIDAKVPTLRLMMESRGGELQVIHHANEMRVKMDRIHVNNVLVSLTDNVVKYSSGEPKLRIETMDKDDMALIKLSDSGIGIEAQYLPYVFDKFYRVPDVKKNGTRGFGLGLSYVKQVVSLHKGQIDIESVHGVGTIIYILIPKSSVDV